MADLDDSFLAAFSINSDESVFQIDVFVAKSAQFGDSNSCSKEEFDNSDIPQNFFVFVARIFLECLFLMIEFCEYSDDFLPIHDGRENHGDFDFDSQLAKRIYEVFLFCLDEVDHGLE